VEVNALQPREIDLGHTCADRRAWTMLKKNIAFERELADQDAEYEELKQQLST
jgi:hypothetical protein